MDLRIVDLVIKRFWHNQALNMAQFGEIHTLTSMSDDVESLPLTKASEERKLRLLALRRRKAGGAEGWATERNTLANFSWPITRSIESILKTRNFDPRSRTLKKHTQADEIEDTVENEVKGLAELVIAEDEKQRAQELVGRFLI